MLLGSTWGNQWEYWQYFDGGVDDHRVMFDGPTKTIWILEGISEILVKEHLYSDWKEWIALYDNSKYPQAFETEGGRPVSATERLGDTYLLINDWTIRQRDASTPVDIIGNLHAYDLNDNPKDPYGLDPYGSSSISSVVSNIVNTVIQTQDVPFVDYDLVAASVWNALKAAYNLPDTMGERMNEGVPNAPTAAEVADAVWDEQISNHNLGGTFGKKIKNIAEDTIWAGAPGDVVSATINTVSVSDGIAQYTGAYDPATLYITDGTGHGQCRNILQYDWDGNTMTGTFVIDRNWRAQPDSTSVLIVVADAGHEHVNEGLMRGGTLNTAILNINASKHNDAYKGQVVFIRSGTGDDQARRIKSYDAVTQTITVEPNWEHTPDATSAYVILPTATAEGTIPITKDGWTAVVPRVYTGP